MKNGSPPGHFIQPAYEPTEENRKTVRALVAYGVAQDDICTVLDISKPTLHKYFRRELDVSMIEANAKVGQSLFNMATNGNVAAAIFWAKVRMGWTETNRTELVGADGGPIQVENARDRIADRLGALTGEPAGRTIAGGTG